MIWLTDGDSSNGCCDARRDIRVRLALMEWTDEGIVLGRAAAWRIQRHRRVADAQPWPPSRPCARRRRLADAAAAAARQYGQRGVAGAARRASRHLRDRGYADARGHPAGIVACGLWRDPSGVAGAAVAGARSARRYLRDAGTDAERFRRRGRGGDPSGPVRTGDADRTRLRPRSVDLCGDRRHRTT